MYDRETVLNSYKTAQGSWLSCFTPPCIPGNLGKKRPAQLQRSKLSRRKHSRNSFQSEQTVSTDRAKKTVFRMTEKPEKIHTEMHSRKRLDSAKRDLQTIVEKIDELGLTSRALGFWRVNSRVRKYEFKTNKRHFWGLTVLVTILYYLAKNYVWININRKCLVDTPPIFQKVFRPPEDCSICLDVQQVEKLANVDPALFEHRYAYSGRPVVITDAMTNWTATEVFSYSYLKTLYDGQDANCQFFPYKSGFHSLQEVFDMSTERALQKSGTQPWYVGWSNCDEKIGTILRQHYHRPYFLPLTAESEKTDWIFMGSPGYGAPMHVDDVAYPSWQAQIRGTKLWILEPPRECHYTCNRLEVAVQPGETIILDTNRWYHQTIIISEEMSITIGAEYD